MRAWKKSCGTEKERGAGKIAGDARLDAAQTLAAANPHFVSFALETRAKGSKGYLPMIPRSQRFFYTRFAIRQKARKQQAGLHLRTSNRHLVADSL